MKRVVARSVLAALSVAYVAAMFAIGGLLGIAVLCGALLIAAMVVWAIDHA